MPLADRCPVPLDQRQFGQFIKLEKARAKPIIDVVVVVGDVIGDRRDLRFEARPAIQLEIPFGVRFGHRPGGFMDRPVVLG